MATANNNTAVQGNNGNDVIRSQADKLVQCIQQMRQEQARRYKEQQYEQELRQTLWEKNRRQLREITGGAGQPRHAGVAGIHHRGRFQQGWAGNDFVLSCA